MTTIKYLERPGGRRIAIRDLTPEAPAGAPVVFFSHVAPGSGQFDPDPVATAAAGVRLITVDRPGYGGSDPVTDGFATVDSAADDAAAALELVLGTRRQAGAVGWSAGGRVALALAARQPELVSRVAVVATPAPDEEVPWIPDEIKAVIDGVRDAGAEQAHETFAASFQPFLEQLQGDARLALTGVGEADQPLLDADPGLTDRLRAMLDSTFAQGDTGLVTDLAGYTLRPWGFSPADVTAPVLLVYGTADFIGEPHATWYHNQLPHAELALLPDAGHLVVVPAWPAVLAHLKATKEVC